MLKRFCLYGFLKNQQYYEPFLILAFLEKGLSFTLIGLLIGFREICVNVLEVPTGAIADVVGRRRSMVFSFLAYIGAFSIFGLSRQVWPLFAAMGFFSMGEAFRTGTHKAMIFDWLARQGRATQKTKVYGFTRSWSKLGSALSAVIAPVLVIVFRSYSVVFLACIPLYLVNVVNFLTYPAYLDGDEGGARNVGRILATLRSSLSESVRSRPLRRLFAESMGFEGLFKVTKDYVQPVVRAAAVALPLFVGLALAEKQRTALLIGVVYCVLNLLSSYASRHADTVARAAGSEQKAARWLWRVNFVVFGVLTAGLLVGTYGTLVAVAAFVALSVIQNFWRPILISRFADRASPSRTATVLSIESQAKSLFAAVVAPLLGLAVDRMPPELRFLPVGLLGVWIGAGMLLTGRGAAQEAAPDLPRS
jgi:MFS family permease